MFQKTHYCCCAVLCGVVLCCTVSCAPGVTAEQFKQQYEKGTVATIAEVTGVPADSITATVEAPTPAAAAAEAPTQADGAAPDAAPADTVAEGTATAPAAVSAESENATAADTAATPSTAAAAADTGNGTETTAGTNVTAAAAAAGNTTAAGSAGRGSRKLLQDAAAAAGNGLKVNFNVQTPDAAATTSKLNDALKDNGSTFFQVKGHLVVVGGLPLGCCGLSGVGGRGTAI